MIKLNHTEEIEKLRLQNQELQVRLAESELRYHQLFNNLRESVVVQEIGADKEGKAVDLFPTDISEPKNARHLLQESEARFKQLADNAPVLIWQSGIDTLCNYFNLPWLNFTGRTLAQEMGNGWAEGVHPDDLEHCLDIYLGSFKAQKPFEIEYRLRCADGTFHWLVDHGIPRFGTDGEFLGYIGSCIDINTRKLGEIALWKGESGRKKLIHELEVHQIELEMQNEELIRAENEAIAATEKYSALYDFAPSGYFTLSDQGTILELNLIGAKSLNHNRSSLNNKPFILFVSGSSKPVFRLFLERVLSSKSSEYCDITIESVGSLPRHFHLTGKIAKDGAFCYLTSIDITQRKQAELALETQNDWLSKITQFSIDLSMLPANEKMEELIARRIKEITGALFVAYSEYDPVNRVIVPQYIDLEPGMLQKAVSLLGQNVQKVHSPVDEETYSKITNKIIGKYENLTDATFGAIPRPVSSLISKLLKADRYIGIAYMIEGELYGSSMLAMGKKQPDPPDEVLKNIAFLVAVSIRRKRAEDMLVKEKWRLESIIEGTNVGTWEWNVQTGETIINEKWANILGYTAEELKPMNISVWEKLAHPDDLEQSNSQLKRHFAGELLYYEYECRLKHRDGHWVWVHDRGQVFTRSEDGKPLKMFGTHTDITQRKLAEEAIETEKRNFQSVFDSSPVPLLVIDEMTNITMANLAAIKLFGGASSEILQHRLGNGLYCIHSSKDARGCGYASECKLCVVRNCIESLIAEGGSIAGADVELELYLNGKPRKVWMRIGVEPLLIYGKNHWCIALDDITVRKQAEKALKKSEALQFKLIQELEVHKIELQTQNEELVRVGKLASDAKEKLESVNSIMELAMSTANMTWWEMDIKTGAVTFGKLQAEMLGYPPEKFKHYKDFTDLLHPEDYDKVMNAMRRHFNGEADKYEVDYRILTKSGEYKWFHDIGSVAKKDNNGKPLTVSGLAIDINERKISEALVLETADRLQKIASHIPGVIYQYKLNSDGSSCFPYASEGIREIYGVNPEEVREDASKVFARLHPDDLAGVPDSIQASATELLPWKYEYRVKSDDGTVRWLLGDALPQREKNGSVLWHGFISDITDRKLMEESLSENEEKYRSIFSVESDSLFLIDNETHAIIETNDSSSRLYGYTREEILQLKNFELSGEPDKTLQSQIELETRIDLRYHKKKDGTVFPVDISASFFLYKGRQTILAAIRDITESKQIELQIQLQNEELQKLNATRDKFFSIIAHDLRSPFSGILGFSNILVEQIQEKNYEGIDEYARIVQKSAERALSLLMNLLEWSRSQTGMIRFSPEYVEVGLLINEVVNLFVDMAQQKSIELSVELPSKVIANGDKDMLGTILRNLISNALKYTNPGGRIVVSAERKPDEVLFSVSDNGVGMKKETLEKIFRIDSGFSTKGTNNEKGTGLGLILCKEFVEKHGGKIWVESEFGKGSSFKFSIPG